MTTVGQNTFTESGVNGIQNRKICLSNEPKKWQRKQSDCKLKMFLSIMHVIKAYEKMKVSAIIKVGLHLSKLVLNLVFIWLTLG
jgi:hypothetical protein